MPKWTHTGLEETKKASIQMEGNVKSTSMKTEQKQTLAVKKKKKPLWY